MVSLPIKVRNKSFIGNGRPFLLKTLKQPPFVPDTFNFPGGAIAGLLIVFARLPTSTFQLLLA